MESVKDFSKHKKYYIICQDSNERRLMMRHLNESGGIEIWPEKNEDYELVISVVQLNNGDNLVLCQCPK